MHVRNLFLGALILLAGCAHKSAPQTKSGQAPATLALSPEQARQRKHLELAVAFDPVFGQKAKASHEDPTGLRVEDFEVGAGQAAKVGSQLTLRFVGYLEDGTIFDQSTKDTGPAFRFILPERPIVEGWGLGLQGMRAGGVRKISVPPALAYGQEGDPADEDVPAIPPNSTLTYLVKMIQVEPPVAGPEAPSAFQGKVARSETMAGGLIVDDYRLGAGEGAKNGDRARLYFRGYLQDGKLFSAKDGSAKAMEVIVGDADMIEGWNKGIIGMKAGGLRKLTVPAEMAFGDKGEGPVPPGAKLTFMIQLVELIASSQPQT